MARAARCGGCPRRPHQDRGGGVRKRAPQGARHGGHAAPSQGGPVHRDGRPHSPAQDTRRRDRAAPPSRRAHGRAPDAAPARAEGQTRRAPVGRRHLAGCSKRPIGVAGALGCPLDVPGGGFLTLGRARRDDGRPMAREIKIYDTTLRDGTQGEGVAFSMEDKVRIAQRLDHLGIHYIEGGWPGSNAKDLRFFKRVQDAVFKTARITAFGATRRPGVRPQEDGNIQALVEASPPVVTIFGKSWDFHVTSAIGTTLPENVPMIGDSVSYLLKHFEEVIYDAEHFFDGYKRNPDYAMRTLLAAEAAGAHCLVLCDTNGGSLPHEIASIIGQVKRTLKPGTPL